MMMDYFLFYEFMRQYSFSFMILMDLELLSWKKKFRADIQKNSEIHEKKGTKKEKKLRGSCEYSHACRQSISPIFLAVHCQGSSIILFCANFAVQSKFLLLPFYSWMNFSCLHFLVLNSFFLWNEKLFFVLCEFALFMAEIVL